VRRVTAETGYVRMLSVRLLSSPGAWGSPAACRTASDDRPQVEPSGRLPGHHLHRQKHTPTDSMNCPGLGISADATDGGVERKLA